MQENITYNEEKEQSIETDPEMTWVVELIDKGIKTIILTVFYVFKNVDERLSILRSNTKDI